MRVREVIHRIESHPRRNELQVDLMQDHVYNRFSENSKKMINDMSNVEYFELCDTDSQGQCSYCAAFRAKRYCILYLWNMPVSCGGHASAESKTI